jgi:hypothetical protein
MQYLLAHPPKLAPKVCKPYKTWAVFYGQKQFIAN